MTRPSHFLCVPVFLAVTLHERRVDSVQRLGRWAAMCLDLSTANPSADASR